MKKICSILLLFFLLLPVTGEWVEAAPPDSEINQLLTEIGWTRQELDEYLGFYEMSVADFDTIADLREMLGTPITEQNLQELLDNYKITRERLDALLAEFGESVDDYAFIEDLDNAVDFYLHHDQEMQAAEAFLEQIGLTDEEVDALFTHLTALDEAALEQEMHTIQQRLEPFMEMEDLTQLTEAQEEELFGIWEDMLTAFHLKPAFQLVDQNGQKTSISLRELANRETLGSDKLIVEFFDLEGNRLLDMQLSEEMLSSDFLMDAGNKLANVGDLAGELTDEMHNGKLPNTASSYPQNMLVGLILLLCGTYMYYRLKSKQV